MTTNRTRLAKVKASPQVHYPSPGKPAPHKTSEKGKFIWAEGQQESGGNYGVRNASSGALGRWQIMPANLPGWATQCHMGVVSPDYFLSHDQYQNDMVWCILGGYYDTYGARGAASMWYSGQPNWQATYGNPPVYVYVDDVIALMGGAPSTLPPGGRFVPNPILGPIPSIGGDDWSIHINLAATHFHKGAVALNDHTKRLNGIRR